METPGVRLCAFRLRGRKGVWILDITEGIIHNVPALCVTGEIKFSQHVV